MQTTAWAHSEHAHHANIRALLEGGLTWPVIGANSDVPEVPDVPDDAVVIFEHPDGSTVVGVDVSRVPQVFRRRRVRRSHQPAARANAEADAAFDALRHQQAQLFRRTTLRRRRTVFLILVVCDALFFAASLLFQLIRGGVGSLRRQGVSRGKSLVLWWPDPADLTLEEMSLSLIIDLVGFVAGLQDKPYISELFLLLQTIGTVLVCLRGFSLFLVVRCCQLVAAGLLRAAVVHYLKLVLPDEERMRLEGMFLGLRAMGRILAGFCGLLCGLE
ncbi:hypothetical protein Agub_g695, partial [Astrephomene gubernaculifera]